MNSSPTTGSGQRSATFGNNVKLNFPISQVPDALRDGVSDYVLIDDKGRIWSNQTDHKYVDKMLQETTASLRQPAG